jgi:hypothetical protein
MTEAFVLGGVRRKLRTVCEPGSDTPSAYHHRDVYQRCSGRIQVLWCSTN